MQKICVEADGKREQMKSLVQTLDSLTSNRTDETAVTEQSRLEQLINRYKNLIPTIEITMTKTDIYLKSYTYKKEVREVCMLLRRVREQRSIDPVPETPESLSRAVAQHESRLSQLEQQRANIISMLQRGKDLMRDQNAPSFVSTELQELESNWNDTYSQSVESLKTLKSSQKLWSNYEQQKNEILRLIEQAERELERINALESYNLSLMEAELRSKRELSEAMRRAAADMLKKLQETHRDLMNITTPERKPVLEEEWTETEERLHTTLTTVQERVTHLQQFSARLSRFQSNMDDLKVWAQQSAPQSIAEIQDVSIPPEEKVRRTENLQKLILEKSSALKDLELESQALVKGELPEAKRLRADIQNLNKAVGALNASVSDQRETVTRNLAAWKEYEDNIQKLKPWIVEAEAKSAVITTRPSSLPQAREMQQKATSFKLQCEQYLPKLQELSQISQQIEGRTVAPDEVDAVNTRWSVLHDQAVQTTTKLDKIVTMWTTFETDVTDFIEWLEKSERASLAEPNVKTPDVTKLEGELKRLKDFNKTISTRQAQLMSFTQVSDHISHSLSVDGASMLKGRVAELKTRVNKLADNVRHQINGISDAVLARQEFDMKVSDFENWMSRLKSNAIELRQLQVNNVDTTLQTVHAYLQEYTEKQPQFAVIYDEVKRLSHNSSPQEVASLDKLYGDLAGKYKAIEDDLQTKKRGLEKWAELLSWHNDTNEQLSHQKYQVEARKPTIADLGNLSAELQAISAKIEFWKGQVPNIDNALSIHMCDKQGKPLTAASLVDSLECKTSALKSELTAKRDRLKSLDTRWDSFNKMQQKLNEDIVHTQTTLQEIIYRIDSCEKLLPAIEEIKDLIVDHQGREAEKSALHSEGGSLMKEDQRAMTNVQVVLSSLDSNWEKVNEMLVDQKRKYEKMDAEWKQYKEAREKINKYIDEAKALCKSVKEVPGDVTQANVALEKHKRSVDILKKGKQFIDKMDSKAQLLLKESSLMPMFKPSEVEADLKKVHSLYQDTYSSIVEKTQAFETQVIIWKQIDETKYELTKWLSDTNEALVAACERLSDADNGIAKLTKYEEELPAYQLIWQGIKNKTAQLKKLNNNQEISTLTSLNQLIEDQFRLVKESADKLKSITSNFSEKEKGLRQELKKSSDLISTIREDIIKCDDLTGDNTKILARISKCKELKGELDKCDSSLCKIEEKLSSLSAEYPAISKSTLPKELQALQQRKSGVVTHAEKIIATLVAFLTKLYQEKFGALQRAVATHKEKIAWCEPEQSSDHYNLEVKIALLADVEAGIADCEAKQKETDKFLHLLEPIESNETVAVIRRDRDNVAADLEALKSSFGKIKVTLEQNIALWQKYEAAAEKINAWMKEMEAKVRSESSLLLNPSEIDDKIRDIVKLQKAVLDHGEQVKKVSALENDIIKVSPESRVSQNVGHLNTRYSAIVKFLEQHLEKLKEFKECKNQYETNTKELEAWITKAEKKLKSFDELSGPKPMSFYQAKLKELKAFNEDREVGQALLNRTSEAGEALFTKIAPEHRESIRSEVRNLRDRMDALIDEANGIGKKIESDMTHRSSFEDKYSQLKQWMIEAQAKLGDRQELLPTLQEKKLMLNFYKTIAQDIGVHRDIMQQLEGRLGASPDDETSEMIGNVIDSYENLSETVKDRISVAEKHVANHEAYLQTFEKTHDWINTIINEATPIIEDFAVERENTESKIAAVTNILQQKAEGDQVLEDCNQQLNIVLEQTALSGHPALMKAFEDQKKIWEDFLTRCNSTKNYLNELMDQWVEFEKIVDDMDAWLKKMELQVKDQSLKSSEDTKRAHLQKLKTLEESIIAKAPEFSSAVEKSQNIEVGSELSNRVSRQVTKYQSIRNQAKEVVARYEQFVKEHSAFNERYNQFEKWVNDVRAELKKHKEIVGDLSVLQNRQKHIRNLCDTRTKENARFESVIDLGEKLYVHTSPDGREIIRQKLKKLRTLWDGFSEDLQNSTQKLDQCLMQFAEFSMSQEQLTAWLRDVERAMHQHTEAKSTLEEKRAQLQNHKIMHQEIMSHQSLVESVCDKAQQLVDQTKDSSLNVYLQSIKQLFHNIVSKSQDLLKNLEDFADKHHQFNQSCKEFNNWLSDEGEKIVECDDIGGERNDISKRLATLAILRDGQLQKVDSLKDLEAQARAVIKNTAPRGQEAVEQEISNLKSRLSQHSSKIGEFFF